MSNKLLNLIPCDAVPKGQILALGPEAIRVDPDFIQVDSIESYREPGKVVTKVKFSFDPDKVYINPDQIALLKCRS